MMSLEQMKEKVKRAYPGDKWKQKVSKMSDGQVVAVYYSLLGQKKIS